MSPTQEFLTDGDRFGGLISNAEDQIPLVLTSSKGLKPCDEVTEAFVIENY